jgi:hypothetical protein
MSSIRQDKTGYVINKIINLVNLVNPVKKRKISVLICVYLWPNAFCRMNDLNKKRAVPI